MSQENLEVVRRVMQRYAEQDIDGGLAHLDPEVVYDWSNSDAPDRGVYTGHTAVRGWMQGRDEALEERRLDFVKSSRLRRRPSSTQRACGSAGERAASK